MIPKKKLFPLKRAVQNTETDDRKLISHKVVSQLQVSYFFILWETTVWGD